MPLYTYYCSHCGATFDRRASIADRDVQRCRGSEDPHCKDPKRDAASRMLTREEITEGNQTMHYNWSKWAR